MGAELRVYRRRIKSVESTKKITKAMELIAASRIVKAQQRVAAARPYSDKITEVLHNLAKGGVGGNARGVKQSNGDCFVIEVNDNPNIDAGVEDRILKADLYRRIMEVFLRRIERRKAGIDQT